MKSDSDLATTIKSFRLICFTLQPSRSYVTVAHQLTNLEVVSLLNPSYSTVNSLLHYAVLLQLCHMATSWPLWQLLRKLIHFYPHTLDHVAEYLCELVNSKPSNIGMQRHAVYNQLDRPNMLQKWRWSVKSSTVNSNVRVGWPRSVAISEGPEKWQNLLVS